MKEHNSILDIKQEKAIIALLKEPTITRAAKSAGIGETTLYRWLKEDEFEQAFREARKKHFLNQFPIYNKPQHQP